MSRPNGLQQDLVFLQSAQVLDKEIYDLTIAIDRIPDEIRALDVAFAGREATVRELESSLKELKLRAKAKELELREKEAQVKKLDGQSAQVKTNKEYTALQGEITALRADNSLMEETLITLFDDVDIKERIMREEQSQLDAARAVLQTKKSDLEVLRQAHHNRMGALKLQRMASVASVDPKLVELYDRLLLRKNGVALAPLDTESCGVCAIKLRPQIVNEAHLNERVTVCENCSRILYVKDSPQE